MTKICDCFISTFAICLSKASCINLSSIQSEILKFLHRRLAQFYMYGLAFQCLKIYEVWLNTGLSEGLNGEEAI
jgi:hypothetical protein